MLEFGGAGRFRGVGLGGTDLSRSTFTAEILAMTCRLDVQKRRQWEERFERYRAGRLTVARFCTKERVSVNTFYYWAKRLDLRSTVVDLRSTRIRSAEQERAAEQNREPVRPTHVSAVAANAGFVHFRLGAAVEVSVPAHCLDVIRCLAQGLQRSSAEQSAAFQEVVVGAR
jgi:hypothetical protein